MVVDTVIIILMIAKNKDYKPRDKNGKLPENTHPEKTRVVVFGSFYRGYHILKNLLEDSELQKRIEIVGVATDDPSKSWTSASKRVWQYPHSQQEEQMVEELAAKHGIPVYKGKVKTPAFYQMLKDEWKPDIVYMGTFGQLLDNTIINTPKLGIYNAHPSDGEAWPSCVGPNPFEQMFDNKKPFCSIALHKANDKFDDGDFTCFSERVAIPYDKMEKMTLGEKVIHMHRLTSPFASALINAHLRSEIGLPLTREQGYYTDKLIPKRSIADHLAANPNQGGAGLGM